MKETETAMAGLLEILSFKAGCIYLSDLRRPEFLPAVRRAVHTISTDRFSLWEWRDAVDYITGENLSFESAEEAAAYLANYQGIVLAEK